jgi:hypothetical protein
LLFSKKMERPIAWAASQISDNNKGGQNKVDVILLPIMVSTIFSLMIMLEPIKRMAMWGGGRFK